MSTNKKINLFFFGAGPIIDNHIKVFKKQENVNLYGILSRTYSKAVTLKKNIKLSMYLKNFLKFIMKKILFLQR